ncbi:acetolactate decarboxylase [Solidesulfovibrio sp. C21]|uniref:acetolactate decarboxylase n=1 Tax=Solidesulfovibrio sp. C21 TaxID=3398613 RepID=UPI0039FBB2C2
MRNGAHCRRVAILAAALWLVLSVPALAAVLYQVGTIASLSAGDYEGRETFATLARHGDFGLGTFENLDGEMVAVDGGFYQVTSDGVARPVAPGRRTPFAQVVFSRGSLDCGRLDGLDLKAIAAALTSRLPDPARQYAVRADGLFSAITTRSVRAQAKPWPPLATAIRGQASFPMENVQGTLVGIYTPPGMQALSPTGWHFHFLTADRRHGGHVLAARAEAVKARGDRIDAMTVIFPEHPAPCPDAPRPEAGAE